MELLHATVTYQCPDQPVCRPLVYDDLSMSVDLAAGTSEGLYIRGTPAQLTALADEIKRAVRKGEAEISFKRSQKENS